MGYQLTASSKHAHTCAHNRLIYMLLDVGMGVWLMADKKNEPRK